MNERFSDPIDEASALEAAMTAGAIAAAHRATSPEKHPDFDGKTCILCANEIPVLRLNLGKIRCVECQRVVELRLKQRAG